MNKPCPKCGSYKVYPGCNDSNCQYLWCERARCAWDNGEICFTQVENDRIANLPETDWLNTVEIEPMVIG